MRNGNVLLMRCRHPNAPTTAHDRKTLTFRIKTWMHCLPLCSWCSPPFSCNPKRDTEVVHWLLSMHASVFRIKPSLRRCDYHIVTEVPTIQVSRAITCRWHSPRGLHIKENSFRRRRVPVSARERVLVSTIYPSHFLANTCFRTPLSDGIVEILW